MIRPHPAGGVPVHVRVSAVIGLLQFPVNFIGSAGPFESVPRSVSSACLLHLFADDGRAGDRHGIDVLMKLHLQFIQAFNQRERVMLDIFQFVRSEAAALVTDPFIIPLSDGLLVFHVQLIGPLLQLLLRDDQRILQDDTILKLNRYGIVRFRVQLVDRIIKYRKQEKLQEGIIVCKIVEIYRRLIPPKRVLQASQEGAEFMRTRSVHGADITAGSAHANRPGHDDVLLWYVLTLSVIFFRPRLARFRICSDDQIVVYNSDG